VMGGDHHGDMRFSVRRPRSVEEFLDLAGEFLRAHEAEHNALLGLCSAMRSSRDSFADTPAEFAVVVGQDGRVVLASLRIPPYNQLLSVADDPAAVDALVGALRGEPLPGVLGPRPAAEWFATGWSTATGQVAELRVAELLYRLERVSRPATLPAGRCRLAQPADRNLLADWFVAFSAEALPDDPPLSDAVAVADRWISRDDRQLYVWEEAQRVVSMAGASGPTQNGIRISGVYTPPQLRQRGYASALTAAASQDQLDRGRRFCFLVTDLANPTANRIYTSIGYQPVCHFDLFRFSPA